jgi:hypothetical protein
VGGKVKRGGRNSHFHRKGECKIKKQCFVGINQPALLISFTRQYCEEMGLQFVCIDRPKFTHPMNSTDLGLATSNGAQSGDNSFRCIHPRSVTLTRYACSSRLHPLQCPSVSMDKISLD